MQVNGSDVKFLVDSGATMTTIDRETAAAAGIPVSREARSVRAHWEWRHPRLDQSRGKIAIGEIERRDVGIQIADNDDLNVLGMNYLSTLSRWSVEGRWLVLVS